MEAAEKTEERLTPDDIVPLTHFAKTREKYGETAWGIRDQVRKRERLGMTDIFIKVRGRWHVIVPRWVSYHANGG